MNKIQDRFNLLTTGTCFIKKIYAPSCSLLQGKHLPFSPSPLRLNIFLLFVILSLTHLYRYTPEIFLFSTAIFKYTYRAPLRQIGQECLPWSKEEDGAYIFWMKQVPVVACPSSNYGFWLHRLVSSNSSYKQSAINGTR